MGALLPALALAVLDWIAVATGRIKAEQVLKPLTMVALIGATFFIEPLSEFATMLGDHTPYLVVAALVFSLAGDVFLMPPAERFIQGLVAFLIAHICYVIAFAQSFTQLPTLAVAAMVFAVSGVLYSRLRVGIIQRVRRELLTPVTVYVVAISLMVTAAAGTAFIDLTPRSSFIVVPGKDWTAWGPVIGGILFYISDAMIGWSRFVRDFPRSRLAIMVTYHLGQIGLVMSVAYAH